MPIGSNNFGHTKGFSAKSFLTLAVGLSIIGAFVIYRSRASSELTYCIQTATAHVYKVLGGGRDYYVTEPQTGQTYRLSSPSIPVNVDMYASTPYFFNVTSPTDLDIKVYPSGMNPTLYLSSSTNNPNLPSVQSTDTAALITVGDPLPNIGKYPTIRQTLNDPNDVYKGYKAQHLHFTGLIPGTYELALLAGFQSSAMAQLQFVELSGGMDPSGSISGLNLTNQSCERITPATIDQINSTLDPFGVLKGQTK